MNGLETANAVKEILQIIGSTSIVVLLMNLQARIMVMKWTCQGFYRTLPTFIYLRLENIDFVKLILS